ncbi:RNA polymerase sigma factor [Lentibacillus sp. JNUCC-1]|uniref:RNA polymerase sigma factor n=1 Tax=Lentibacillus sp. JNUCC-1 TaxID=2654513 RepID=UPI002F919E47
MERLREKEEEALIELMNTYGDYLLRTAILLVKDTQTAEEIVQDTFVTAFNKITQLDDPAKLKSWLTTITVNKCRSQMRKWSWKHIRLHKQDEHDRPPEIDPEAGPEEQFLTKLTHARLANAIQELDYTYREVITLYYFNEMKIKDIAHYTKSSDNTIKSRLTRGRAKLKTILEKEEREYDSKNRSSET